MNFNTSNIRNMGSNLYKYSKKAVDTYNENFVIKIKDSRIYQENDLNVFKIDDTVISKNLHELGEQINNYYKNHNNI